MSVRVRIGTEHYPVAELLARRYPDLGFDRGKRGKRRRWHRGYWYLLEGELKNNIDDVEFYINLQSTVRFTFATIEEVLNAD